MGDGESTHAEVIRFGSFRLLRDERLLFDGEVRVHVGHRALDILMLLIERAGEFVSNDEIVARIWPRSVVVEGNLRVHIAALRKVLGDGRDGRRYIVNVPNRGYQFAAQAVTEVGQAAADAGVASVPPRTSLPVPLHRIIGREAAIESLASQVRSHRLVTVVGAGGIGKTTVAVSVVSTLAKDLSKTPWSSVHFVDLSPLQDPRLVPNALAAALGLSGAAGDVVPSLVAYLNDRAALLLFDTCEHVITSVVEMIEIILRAAPRVHVLATCREPLRADGEWTHRLQALALPGDAPHATVEEATAFGAIELFVERAAATMQHIEFCAADVPHVVKVCRRLDGIPLAIELAAARVEALGFSGVATALEDSFALLSRGRRTAFPRQRTLEATLDTTRSYAEARLSRQPEAGLLRRRHIAYCISFLEAGARVWTETPTLQWVQRYGVCVDDVRSALRWAFSDHGDIQLGIELTAKAVPMLFQMSLANEARFYTKQALDAVASLPGADPRLRFELSIHYGHVLVHTGGLPAEFERVFAEALEIAQATGDRQSLALAYSTNCMAAYALGEPARMREYAARFRELAAEFSDPAIQLLDDRLHAPTLHFSGDQNGARRCAERSLATRTLVRSPFLSGALIDRRVSMGCILARALWLLGLAQQANKVILEAIDVAIKEGESIALALILGFAAIPLAIWSGAMAAARVRLDLALRHTAEHSLIAWRNYPLAYKPLLDWHEQGAVGQPLLAEPIGVSKRPPQLGEILATLHASYADEATLERGDSGKAGWCEAELLRLRGERLMATDQAKAESCFQRSLELATAMGTLAWELRTSISLARLWAGTDRADLARERMESALFRVQEGFSTPDVRVAMDLYESLALAAGKYPRSWSAAEEPAFEALPPSCERR